MKIRRVAVRSAITYAPYMPKAAFWVLLVRISLLFTTHQKIRSVFVSKVCRAVADPVTEYRIARCVVFISKFVPKATCLTQAIAAQIMLSRCKISSTIFIGIAIPGRNEFSAHAWLESGERILLGGTRESLKGFTALARFQAGDQ